MELKENLNEENLYDFSQRHHTLMYATIELLTACNWRCKHCYIPNHNSFGLTLIDIKRIFCELRELYTYELTLTGGEMFMRTDIMDIISLARKMGFNLQLFTNISLINENIVRQLSDLYIERISCTIFSLDEKIHDDITGVPGSLKQALSSIESIKKSNITLEIKTILFDSNYTEYKKLKKYCEDNGFKYLATASISPKTDGCLLPLNLKMTYKHLDAVILEIDDIRNFKKRNISQESPICNSINHSIAIDCRGNIYPCNNMNVKIGNIYISSISDVWQNSEALTQIRNIKYKDLEKCSKCDNRDFCYRCAGTALRENGSLTSISTLECMHADIRHKKYNEFTSNKS